MALIDDAVYEPGEFVFVIPQGQHFHLEFPPFLDAVTGERFNFPDDPEGAWDGRMDVRNASGEVLISFATSGEDGTVTLDEYGVASVDLLATYTGALDETTGLPGIGGLVLAGDLVLTDPIDGQPRLWFKGRGKVTRRITA